MRRERRQPRERRRRFFDGPPDIAIEVVSPGDTADEVARKVQEYLEAGTPRVWTIQPALQTVTVYRPDITSRTYHSGEVLSSDDAAFEVAGFSLPIAELFAED